MQLFAILKRAPARCVAVIAAETAGAAIIALVQITGEGQAYTIEPLAEQQSGFTHVVAELPPEFDAATPLASFALLKGLSEGPGPLAFFAVKVAADQQLPFGF